MSPSEGYRIIQRIGAGAAGPVYLAESGAQRVAIRQFQSSSPGDTPAWRSERAQFLQAGRVALDLKHARILPVVEVIDDGDEAFVAMEYTTAETLQAALAARRFSPYEADVLLRQVAMALDFAHERGVIHGDLKPSNIFLLPDQGAKVSDFAISPWARRDLRRPVPPDLAHAYLSPEHLRGQPAVTAQSDQYSLGVIVYEMYTGQLPSPSGAVPKAEIVPPSRLNRQLPPSVDGPLLRALDPDPARRFPSCMAFVTQLDAALIAHPEQNGGGRSRKLLYAGVAALLLAVLALYWLWPSKKGRVAESQPPVAAPLPEATAVRTGKAASNKKAHTQPAEVADAGKPTPFQRSPGGKAPKAPAQAPGGIANATLQAPASTRPDSPSRPWSARDFDLAVLSRGHGLENGTSFAFGDQVLGELAQGDLKAVVKFGGGQPPRGVLTLDWSLNGIILDVKPVRLDQAMEYGNEPTPGSYRVTLRLDAKEVKSFVFRITP